MSQKLKLEDVITQVPYEDEFETVEYQYSYAETLLRKIFCCFPKAKPKRPNPVKKRKKEPSFSNIFKSNPALRIETDDDELILMEQGEVAQNDPEHRNRNGNTKKKRTREASFTRKNEKIYEEAPESPRFIESLLGPPIAACRDRKTLVLDLDETLVHSSFKKGSAADIVVHIEIESFINPVYVLKRPGVDEFLRAVGEMFEIVIFTASLAKYANPLLDQLDKDGVIHHRLFREHCTFVDGAYKKDLSRLGRDVSQVIIIDNSPICYDLQPENAIPVSSWFDDRSDRELFALVPWLQRIAQEKEVYGVLADLQNTRMKMTKPRHLLI